MLLYPAIIDGEQGAYGVVFPDLPGIAAMGDTVDAALANAKEVLRDYAIETGRDGDDLVAPSSMEDVEIGEGERLVSVPLIRPGA